MFDFARLPQWGRRGNGALRGIYHGLPEPRKLGPQFQPSSSKKVGHSRGMDSAIIMERRRSRPSRTRRTIPREKGALIKKKKKKRIRVIGTDERDRFVKCRATVLETVLLRVVCITESEENKGSCIVGGEVRRSAILSRVCAR